MKTQIREKIEYVLNENLLPNTLESTMDIDHYKDLRRICRAVIPLVEALTEIADLGTATSTDHDTVPNEHHIAMRVVNSAKAHLALKAFTREISGE